jgi:predicted HicB family RNase H-like nuclease
MPRSTQIIPVRIPHDVAARIRATAAAASQSVNAYVARLLAAATGSAPKGDAR